MRKICGVFVVSFITAMSYHFFDKYNKVECPPCPSCDYQPTNNSNSTERYLNYGKKENEILDAEARGYAHGRLR